MRLARALLGLAARRRERLGAVERSAIDQFVTDPTPSAFLAARRALVSAVRADLGERGAGDRQARAAATLEAAGLPAPSRATLAALPTGARTSGRLDALALLIMAERELTARIAAATAMLRARWKR